MTSYINDKNKPLKVFFKLIFSSSRGLDPPFHCPAGVNHPIVDVLHHSVYKIDNTKSGLLFLHVQTRN